MINSSILIPSIFSGRQMGILPENFQQDLETAIFQHLYKFNGKLGIKLGNRLGDF